MACYEVIRLPVEIKATQDEILNTLKVLGFKTIPFITYNVEYVNFAGGSFRKINDKWEVAVTQNSSFDVVKFQKELQRTKILTIAKQKGYKVIENKEKNNQIFITLSN